MRLFVAAAFPEAVLRPLNECVSTLRPRLPAASWVRPEAQHLTLAFLGEQKEELVERLTAVLIDAAAESRKFEARLKGCGFFPNPRHARVGWIGVEPHSQFAEVAEKVRSAVQRAGVTLDGGDFRPHLTLMRVRDRWPPASIETFHQKLREYQSDTFPVEKVTLYSSRLNPKGAEHTAVREFELG